MAKNKKEATENSILCEGISLSRTFYEKKENRLLTLLLKGFIVYLLSMGSVGFYLSALKIEYNVVLCHIVIAVMAICCALLYYRLLVENLGYFLLLIVFGGLVVIFRDYINSGFYAIVNMTVDEAAEYFDVDIQRLYNEQIGNRYVTVTCVVLFIGIVLDILLNVYISRRMQYVTAIVIVMFLNVIPLYMTDEPDLLYSMMLLVGIAMTYVFKSGKHYSPQVSVKRTDRIFEKKGTRKKKKRNSEISYVYDVKVMGQVGVTVALVVMAAVTAISSLRPKENFNVGYTSNKYKEFTMEIVSMMLVEGRVGFFGTAGNSGGIDGGRLGTVSTVHLDYQTDLVVQVAPYSYETIYLRSFVGEQYNPYQNLWTSINDLKWYDDSVTPEANALEQAYETGQPGSARGVMIVRNVDADFSRQYLPYYSRSYETDERGNTEIIYYPRLQGNDVRVLEKEYGKLGAYTAEDLYVPEENKEAIAQVVGELELSGNSPDDAVSAVSQYFQENIPYTIRPGKTPKNEDFVNYFLTENRKGYCSHYASAATLMFRYMGIPARYVEGYAVDFYQITDGELVEDAEYKDYYDGYSELGETALVEVKVTDADAHAWVEIYTAGEGWHVVDVTPAGETEEVGDFWDAFENFMGDSDTGDDTTDITGGNGLHVSDAVIRRICYALLVIVLLAVLAALAVRGGHVLVYVIRYKKSGINDRLIMRYASAGKRYARKHKDFKEKINYREQIEYIAEQGMEFDEKEKTKPVGKDETASVIDILERAGFSNQEITEEEYAQAVAWIQQTMK